MDRLGLCLFPLWQDRGSVIIRVTPFHFSPLQTTFLISFCISFFVRCTVSSVFRVTIGNRWFGDNDRCPCSFVGGSSNFRVLVGLVARGGGCTQGGGFQNIVFFPSFSLYLCQEPKCLRPVPSPLHSSASVLEITACKSGEGCYSSPVRRRAAPGDLPRSCSVIVRDSVKGHDHDVPKRMVSSVFTRSSAVGNARTIVDLLLPRISSSCRCSFHSLSRLVFSPKVYRLMLMLISYWSLVGPELVHCVQLDFQFQRSLPRHTYIPQQTAAQFASREGP